MNKTKQLLTGLVLAIAATSASATVLNFKDMANSNLPSSERGEQDWSPVSDVTINGYYNNTKVYAYLDSSWGGLGVCKNVGDALVQGNIVSNQCLPSSDDNVQVGEYLNFVFDTDVRITSISFNNRHDVDQSLLNDTINITNVGDYTFTAADGAVNDNWTYNGLINVDANTDFNLSWVNENFYITSITYATPEPAIVGLLALGLIGLGFSKRKNA